MRAWETLFEKGGLGLHENLFKALNPKTFHQEDQQLTQLIIQLYTMETFLYESLCKAAQSQDESKVKNLGPFACALRAILHGNTDVPDKVAYRGLLLDKQEFDYFKVASKANEKIKLQGFTSASADKEYAMKALLRKYRDHQEKIPVMVQIFLQQNIDTFEADSGACSQFHLTEKEIVLLDGMAFRFASAIHRQDGRVQQMNLIQL